MGLSLVAVFAIIATLGLLSLNSASAVQADEHTVAGGTALMAEYSFSAPADMDNGDRIEIDLAAAFTATDGAFTGVTIDVGESSFIGFDPPSIAGNMLGIELNNQAAIEQGSRIKVSIDGGMTITVPAVEGTYATTAHVNMATGADFENVASMDIVVENMVSDVAVTVAEMDEDVASGEVMVEFKTNMPGGALSMDNNDTIMVMLEDFVLPGSIANADVTIMGGTNNYEASPRSVNISGDTITLAVPDMDTNIRTQNLVDDEMVTVTFSEDAGIMNPMNGGSYSVKVYTSKASKPGEEEVMVDIMPTMPDVTKVEPSTKISGMYTGLTVRFITDDNLFHREDSNDSWMRIHGEEVASTDKIMLDMGDFAVPDFFPPNSVKINGRDVEVSDSDTETGMIELVLTHDIEAGNPVVLTFLHSAEIMNPILPVTDPPTEMMDYPVMVKTTAEDDYASWDVPIVAAPPEMMVPPGGVQVTVEPNTAGSATKLTVQFTTGDDGTLAEDAEIFIMAPNFGIPTSIDADNVTVNGAAPKSVAVSGSDDRIILTLASGIPANRRVSVVFKVGAGITNPAKAGTVDVSVSTTSEGQASPMKVAIMEPPEAAMIQAIEVVPQVPGEDSRITFKFITPSRLSSIENSEVIFRFHDNFSVTGGRIDVSKTTIQANSIFGGPEVDTPKASGVVNPTSATVTYETVDREPQIRLAVPDMADDEGDQHILRGAMVTVVFQQGSGIINPTEASSYGVQWAVNDDNSLDDLGDVVLPVVVGLSGDGGKRGTSVTAVAKGVEGGEAVLFWLDTATAMAGSKTYNAPDGMYDPDIESVLCRATAESNDTATCVFEVANPPFSPGVDLWVNVQDSEGRRVGTLKGSASTGYDWAAMIKGGHSLSMHPINEAFVQLDARVTIKPSEVNIGDTVTVSMFDYLPGGGLEVKIGSVTLNLNAPGVEFRQRAVQGSGEQSFTFSIPATVGGTPIPLGKVRVDVNKTGLTGHDFKADTNITIAGATVTLAQSFHPGQPEPVHLRQRLQRPGRRQQPVHRAGKGAD